MANINHDVICSFVKDCINNKGKIFIVKLNLGDFVKEDFQGIAEWEFVRAYASLQLVPEHSEDSEYQMFIDALIRVYNDGTIAFEEGDALMSDLNDREDIIIKIFKENDPISARTKYQFGELENPIFCSSEEDCSFFQGKVSWISWETLEDSLFKLDANKLKRLKSDCRKIIDTAKLLEGGRSYR